MRLSDSLILENISVSPFSNNSKEDKRKASAHKRRRRKKMTIIPSVDESATKKYVSRGGYRKAVSFTVILPIAEAIA